MDALWAALCDVGMILAITGAGQLLMGHHRAD
jgi:hypothetical protein